MSRERIGCSLLPAAAVTSRSVCPIKNGLSPDLAQGFSNALGVSPIGPEDTLQFHDGYLMGRLLRQVCREVLARHDLIDALENQIFVRGSDRVAVISNQTHHFAKTAQGNARGSPSKDISLIAEALSGGLMLAPLLVS
jgi:hypothetical protein